MRRAEEPIDVLMQPEDRRPAVAPLVATDAFEHAETVVQRVRQHVDLGGVPGHQLAVEPDVLALLHAESPSPLG